MMKNKSNQNGFPDNSQGDKKKRRAFLSLAIISVAALAMIVTMQPPCSCGTRSYDMIVSQAQAETPPAAATSKKRDAVATATLPRLVDFGARKCIPCQMMFPIIDELKKEYAAVFKVEFIDVWKNQDQARKYNIRRIPTQVFFDRNGKELFRHEGFLAKEDILKKMAELGVQLKTGKKK